MTVDHVSDGKVDIPAAMVEAAARVLYDADGEFAPGDRKPWEERSEDGRRAIYGTLARAVLAAAFAECEVRELWSAQLDDGGSSPWLYGRAALDGWLEVWRKPHHRLSWQRRLQIRTPVVVTPDEGDQQ